MSSSATRRLRQSVSLLAWLAIGIGGCSSTEASLDLDPGYGDGNGYEGGNAPADPDDEPADEPNDGATGGPDDGGDGSPPEPPPEPDDRGVDNETDEESCNADDEVTLFLSPDDSNSMSSPVQVRETVLSGWGSVQSVAIRTWEFFNYYDFGYPAAAPGTVAITPTLFHPPGAPDGEYLLQVGVSSEFLSAQSRPPVNVTLVVDTSGSMEGIAMDMLKESSLAIASSLREGDVVSLVTWSTDDAVILGGHVVDGPDDSTLVAEIEAIEAGGGTDLHGGLVTGYALAQEHYTDDAINRVVLVSDGGANAGVTDTEIIAQHAGAHDQDGIYMIGVGVGDAASYNDNLMDSVTDAGKGASVFIGNPDEAWARFGDDFVSTMGVAARDVQVRLELPPGFEIIQTSAEEWSEDPSEVEPQHLAPNDAMVFHQRIRTCAPQLLAEQTPITVTARYLDATTFELVEVEHSAALNELLGTDPAPLLKGSAIFAYAESLKAYKRADFGAKASALEPAKAALDAAEAALPGDPDLAEIREVIEALSL